jgi:hypothetical protein
MNDTNIAVTRRKTALITGGASGMALPQPSGLSSEGAPRIHYKPPRCGSVCSAGGDRRKCDRMQRRPIKLTSRIVLFAQIEREKGSWTSCSRTPVMARFAPLGQITEEHYDSLFNHQCESAPFSQCRRHSALAERRLNHPECIRRLQQRLAGGGASMAPRKPPYVRFARTWITDLKGASHSRETR